MIPYSKLSGRLISKKLVASSFYIFDEIKKVKLYFTCDRVIALLVQLVERRFPKPDVVGSSPTGRVLLLSFFFYLLMIY